jgi:hypothetical protein
VQRRAVTVRRAANFNQVPGEEEADAVRRSFLQGSAPTPHLGAALGSMPATQREQVVERLQRERGNAFVQGLARLAKPAPSATIQPVAVQRESEEEKGGKALAQSLKRFNTEMTASRPTLEQTPGIAADVAPNTTYKPALDVWNSLVEAMASLVTEHKDQLPIPAPEQTIAANKARLRLSDESRERTQKQRKAGAFHKKVRNIPLLSSIAKSKYRKHQRKARQVVAAIGPTNHASEQLRMAYEADLLNQIKASPAGQAYEDAQQEINRVLKATGADRTDTDTLEIIIKDIAKLRRDPSIVTKV